MAIARALKQQRGEGKSEVARQWRPVPRVGLVGVCCDMKAALFRLPLLWHRTAAVTNIESHGYGFREGAARGEEEIYPPFVTIDGDPACGMIFLCDHAENRLPARYGTLGLPAEEFERHIAYDPGARAVTRGLARRLGAPAVLTTFSRLLIDPNRGEDDPTLIMRLSDGAIVPGNHHVDAGERARRLALYHAPYHAEVERTIERSIAAGTVPLLVSIHSFTPVWRGAAGRGRSAFSGMPIPALRGR